MWNGTPGINCKLIKKQQSILNQRFYGKKRENHRYRTRDGGNKKMIMEAENHPLRLEIYVIIKIGIFFMFIQTIKFIDIKR